MKKDKVRTSNFDSILGKHFFLKIEDLQKNQEPLFTITIICGFKKIRDNVHPHLTILASVNRANILDKKTLFLKYI